MFYPSLLDLIQGRHEYKIQEEALDSDVVYSYIETDLSAQHHISTDNLSTNQQVHPSGC